MKAQGIDVALKVAEQHQARDMGSKISARMRASMNEHGARDDVRSIILTYVASENYAKALEELQQYVESKSDYPQFRSRAERYLTYSADLINAVRAKRSFPGMHHLNMSRQQDLYDRAISHFEDLKVTLKKIVQIEQEVKLEDVRSTVWVVKAVIFCIFAMLVVGFLIELSKGVLPSANIVTDDMLGTITNFAFDKLGL